MNHCLWSDVKNSAPKGWEKGLLSKDNYILVL